MYNTIDTADTLTLPRVKKPATAPRAQTLRALFSWLLAWEIYPILFIATFLRLYHAGTTEFDADQAAIFAMARNAVTHGLIPITTNVASIGIVNPPATVYLLMLGAVFSANPLVGIIVTAGLNILAVLLTYALVRRYYGRVAGTTAGLLYAAAQLAVYYSRFPWNQNLLAPFVPLFLFALFWGVVERRRGWLAPAVLLWGWMIQLHGSAVFLAIPLLLACILAFQTLRWRDIFLAAGLLLLIYAPYMVWEFTAHLVDIPILLRSLGKKSVIDTLALQGYLEFLNPYIHTPTNPATLQFKIYTLLRIGRLGAYALTLAAFIFALCATGLSRWHVLSFVPRGTTLAKQTANASTTFWSRVRAWYTELVATPWRCGLLILLVWQILPLLALSHHSIQMFNYYLLVLMPGPFILMGILAAQIVFWLSEHNSKRPSWRLARYAFLVLLTGLILIQATGTFTWIVDEAQGNHAHSLAYNTLQDEEHALTASDQLARSHHIHHIYIDMDSSTQAALTYLSGQLQTPYTLASGNCLLLPGTTEGPAVLLLRPGDTAGQMLLNSLNSAQLVAESARLGSNQPYQLYILQPVPANAGSTATFTHDLAFQAQNMSAATATSQPLLLTRWNVLRTAPAAYGTSYSYHLSASSRGNGLARNTSQTTCSFSSLQSGEQLLMTFASLTDSTALPASLTLSGSTWTTTPYTPSYGPFHLETLKQQNSPVVPLQSSTGSTSITVLNQNVSQ
jgi:hypothetical protein